MKRRIAKLLVIFVLLTFNFVGSTNSFFVDRETIENNSVSAGCWLPPSVPILVYPPDNHIAGAGSAWDLNPYMDWQDSTTTCPLSTTLTYQYESYRDPGLTIRLYQSGWLTDSQIPAPGTPDGIYYWHVRSQDNFGNESGFSAPWKLTVDRSAPDSEITSLDLFSTASSFSIDYEADADTDFVQLCYSYNLGDWICNSFYIDHPNSPGSVLFDSPRGDGLYDFYTLATDHAGNTEDDSGKTTTPYSVQVDTLAPTTNIDLNSLPGNYWNGQNLLANGDFESGLDSWTIDASASGDHRVVSTATDFSDNPISPPSGLSMLQIGFSQSPLINNSADSVSHLLSLPANLSSNLSFSYRFFSQDTADYDHFFVKIISWTGNLFENIILTGNEFFVPDYDSGWQKISHSLLVYAGHTINLLFGVGNKDVPGNPLASWAFIDDIFVSTLDTRVEETGALSFDPHDIGSGLFDTPSDVDTQVGENPLDFLSTDVAGNIEATHSSDIVVLRPVVLNHIAPAPSSGSGDETIVLYNNSVDSQDLSDWQICDLDNNCQTLTETINTGSTLALSQNFYLNNDGDTVKLKDNTSAVVDEFTYPNHSGHNWSWQRNPDGIGTWQLFIADMDFNLISRPSVNKITLSIFNIPGTYGQAITDTLDYEIIYAADGIDKGIFGHVNPENIINGKIDYDFYLGTCTTGSVCTPDINIGSTLTVIISGSINSNPVSSAKTFNY